MLDGSCGKISGSSVGLCENVCVVCSLNTMYACVFEHFEKMDKRIEIYSLLFLDFYKLYHMFFDIHCYLHKYQNIFMYTVSK